MTIDWTAVLIAFGVMCALGAMTMWTAKVVRDHQRQVAQRLLDEFLERLAVIRDDGSVKP